MFFLLLFSTIGAAMSPHRPDLMIFKSPDKKLELHSPVRENSSLIKKHFFKNDKIQWPDSIMNVEYVFSDPSLERLITIGGLGDSGASLGNVTFYKFTGEKVEIELKEFIPNLEDLSRAIRDFSNFPWISGIDLNSKELNIWVCNKVMAKINLKDLKVVVSEQKEKPKWLVNEKNILSLDAEKLRWNESR